MRVKSFLDCFPSNGILDHPTSFSPLFCILRFGRNLLGRLIGALYCRVSGALATLPGLITYRNIRLFIVDCITKFYEIYRSTNIKYLIRVPDGLGLVAYPIRFSVHDT